MDHNAKEKFITKNIALIKICNIYMKGFNTMDI